MRKSTPILFSCFTIACLALWHVPSAQAQLIVYEGYDYDEAPYFPETEAGGLLDGGIGWDGAWRTRNIETQNFPSDQVNNAQAILADGLSYTDSQGNRLQVSGRALDITHWSVGGVGANQGIPEREIDTSTGSPADLAELVGVNGSLGKIGTTLWMSVLMEGRDEFVPTGDTTSNGFSTRDLNLAGANRSIDFGRPAGLKLDGTRVPSFTGVTAPNLAYGIARSIDGVIRSSGTVEDRAQPVVGSGVATGFDLNSGEGAPAVKAFMVLKLDFNGTFDEIAEGEFGLEEGDYGTNVSAWINPDLDADLVNDPSGPNSGTFFADEVNYWQISFNLITRIANADTTLDELRIGATYADVAPIDTSLGPDGDFDVDGDVDGADFLLWQRNQSVGDLSLWEGNFGAGGSSVATVGAVPEPSTMMLLGLTLAGFAGIRRR